MDWVKLVKVLGVWYQLRRDFGRMGYEARREGDADWHFARSITFALIRAWDGNGDPYRHGVEVKEAERVYGDAFNEGSLCVKPTKRENPSRI